MWVGSGGESLGLVGEVEPADLRAVLAGLAPGTGLTPNGTALRAHPRRVPGFDLTFAVPKSVSVAYALADRRVQHLIVTACEAALGETLGWLEREACFVRRGTNKAENRETWGEAWGTRRMVARGFVGAAYRHRTSRAGDPHLHWHVLAANLAQGIDGRWSALDGRAIYDTARTGGAVFQAAMRRELTAALGVEWGPVHEDAAEIAGIPTPGAGEFSRRREQIAEWLDDAGEAGPAAAAVAQRATRTRKQVPADFTGGRGRLAHTSRSGRLGAGRPRAAAGLRSPFSRPRWFRDRGRVVAQRCPLGDDTARRVRRVARLAARSPGHGPRRDVHPVRSDPHGGVGASGVDVGGGRRGDRAAGVGVAGGGADRRSLIRVAGDQYRLPGDCRRSGTVVHVAVVAHARGTTRGAARSRRRRRRWLAGSCPSRVCGHCVDTGRRSSSRR